MGYTADISMFPYFKNELKEENEENNLIDKNDLLEMIMDEGFDTDLYDEEDFDVEIFIHNVKEHIEEEKEEDEKENDELKDTIKSLEGDKLELQLNKDKMKEYYDELKEENEKLKEQLKEENEKLKEQLKETLKMNIQMEYEHIKQLDKLDDEIIKVSQEKKTLRKENETLKMKLVSLEEFKEKAFEENTASAVCETMMERIDTLEHKLEDYKQTITVHKDECLRNVRRANSYDEYIMKLVLGDGNHIENIDENIMEKIDQNELNVLLEVLENNGIYYCVDDDEFADDEADIQCADMCNQYRQDMDEDDDESDIDIEGYCDWYCSNYGVSRHWLKEGFIWTK